MLPCAPPAHLIFISLVKICNTTGEDGRHFPLFPFLYGRVKNEHFYNQKTKGILTLKLHSIYHLSIYHLSSNLSKYILRYHCFILVKRCSLFLKCKEIFPFLSSPQVNFSAPENTL